MRNILTVMLLLFVAQQFSFAQATGGITIGGNIYGGGNHGDTGGKTSVTIYKGDLHCVYGGARMADVGGSAFVHIDGEHASDYIIVDKLYGGNDIAGTIGTSAEVPAELSQVGIGAGQNNINNTWNVFVRISTKTEPTGEPADDAQKIFIGQLFGGGNGDYIYSAVKENGMYDVTVDDTTYEDVQKPVLAKTYLELLGGSINYAYGGGNNVTVTDSTVICFDNPSEVVVSIEDANGEELLNDDRFRTRMGINLAYSYPSSDAFHVGRFYGGNNLAEMAIRPTWNLKSGKIRNLYSGGNQGAMTSPDGLLLEIPATSTIVVDNLYGGCRMADVKPTVNGEYKAVSNLPGYNFPPGLSARVLIRGGDVNNVYGGNDITGRVYGGSAVGIRTSVCGDVYGGGNGSYAYTDNPAFEGDETYGDLYYTVPAGKTSVEALNDFRPNAEQVSIHLLGNSTSDPAYIGGSVYCGGNSATLKTSKSKPMVELKIGSYVVADKVFLGNNGVNMIKYNAAGKTVAGTDSIGAAEGVLYSMQRTDLSGNGSKFSSLDLENAATFEAYMQGVAMPLVPNLVYDDETKGDGATYIPYTSLIGSFFCGGNVGSMSAPGTIDLDNVNSIRIYNKFVGGCNDAYVPAHTGFNAACDGGFTVESNPKIRLNLNGLKLYPMQLVRDGDGFPTGLAWHTNGRAGDLRRFVGANVYGGCYNSGHINGNVEINVNDTTVNKQHLFEDAQFNVFGDETAVQIANAGVSFDAQREEIFLTSLGIFGAGYGENSEVWGSTTINLYNGYNFLIFGGGEKGVVGKKNGEGNYVYNSAYSTTINLNGTNPGTEAGGDGIPAAEYIYAGGFEGLVAGDTKMNLGNGRVNASFGGACNADILGHSETYVGKGGGFPYVVEDVYGANDLGGSIRSAVDFKTKVREAARTMMHNGGAPATASAYTEYLQGRVRHIFGGCYGKYDYSKKGAIIPYNDTVHVNVDGVERDIYAPYIPNAFVHVRPELNENSSVTAIFGAGEGDTNYEEDGRTPKGADPIGDMLQDRSYVLVDIPEGYTKLKNTKIYGAGSFNGLGMWIPKATADNPERADSATAVIDLIRGELNEVHGGGYEEGLTRRTLVNVPDGSVVKVGKIFGGSEGTSIDKVCDVYESHVNYNSETATVGTLYGGNNNVRQTLYAHVDVSKPAWSDRDRGYKATVYGAGYGLDTRANYTEVNLNDGATVYEVYGGGEMGRVVNVATSAKIAEDSGSTLPKLPNGYGDGDKYPTGLADGLAKVRLDGLKHNTNVLIHKGATVENYAYGGGRGYDDENTGDGDVNGTTYIALMGGTVKKDIYAAGTIGAVLDEYGNINDYRGQTFVADATAYIAGGSARNVYGGGWKGSVGKHKKLVGGNWVDASISDIHNGSTVVDVLGTTHVYVGIRDDQSNAGKLTAVQAVLGTDATIGNYGYYAGVPAIQRNAYGGGEGGAVFGVSNLTINNGYIGYVYFENEEDITVDTITYHNAYGGWYQEKLHDETWTDHIGANRLYGSGNVFGGGYIDNSSVDSTRVTMWNGMVRNSLFGGGEIAAIGRGDVTVGGYQNSVRTLRGKYKLGKTHVEMYNGHVQRDVFAGGKGYDNLGKRGTLYTDGYVFGQTEAFIRGGEIGTADNYDDGYGNVFGGGDLGYVYGKGIKSTRETGTAPGRCYYTIDGSVGGTWTEDCKVVVEPYAQVLAGQTVTIGGTTYSEYEYVPVEKLNLLKGTGENADGPTWAKLDGSGIIIRNAVFGGGNVADGSDKVYANTKTVFGNVTAALRDVACRDLITIGTEHIGGLYGGGNLSLVDGYRELHISNYGTDYYGLSSEIDMDEYNSLTDRERAYFRLRYTCNKSFSGDTYQGVAYKGHTKGDQIYEDEYNELPLSLQTVGEAGSSAYWVQDGVCSIYAGRLLNTLQRADLVGVIGSRMVLQGARDRVTEVQDNTNYTINRVGELSLEKVTAPTGDIHGNYFGIYSVVNYLGNLTSDVLMTDTRVTDSGDADGKSYHDWKAANLNSRKRNTATCHNQVALASGVFLELTTEYSGTSGYKEKEYGYITGVVELDLINAKADAIGGGYVYAKNEHGTRRNIPYTMIRLSEYNRAYNLRTYRMYEYDDSPASNLEVIQTSGNFIHGKAKTIIDDCYPHNLEYDPADAEHFSDAHYWYIKGSIYIYDQVISAYTGAPTAYIKEKHIPLTITAGSHGQLKLINVQPNLYAYWADSGHSAPIAADGEIKVSNGSVTYKLNDVITYWDWSQLSADEQALFEPQTYVNVKTGAVSLSSEGEDVHPSNNISHDTGYVLDFKMNTPSDWNTWYSPKTGGGDSISTTAYNGKTDREKDAYMPGPTYSTSLTGVYGQRTYYQGEIVPKSVFDSYSNPGTGDQATVTLAYITAEPLTYTYNSQEKSVGTGAAISKTEYDALETQAPAAYAKFKAAKMCINSLKLNDETYIVYGDLLSGDSITALKTAFSSMATEIDKAFTDAYICENDGLYGGTSYDSSTRYSALEGWAALTSADRAKNKFKFNYDGFDVLIDPAYTGDMSKYHSPYKDVEKVEYVAIYNGATSLDASAEGLGTIARNDTLTREKYELLTNEKYHYTPIVVSNTAAGGDDIYIAKDAFTKGSMAYAKGQVIQSSTYRILSASERTALIETVRITNTSSTPVTYYYCREAYTGENSVTNRKNGSGVVDSETVNGSGTSVAAGWIIDADDYADHLVNKQKNFIIKGEEPTETTTLYVSRESNIQDLSKEKIISVIYQYTYNESDDSGENVSLSNEMHVVNIHLQFESGAPIIDNLLPPATVLPGTTVGINQPRVTPGAYELIGGGWEIFTNKSDAELHRNGSEYKNNETPMYYYQDGYYLAYYAKSYMGKTYSEPVKFSVANYHDLKAVMDAKEHHYYIDHKDAHTVGKRIPKIYINDYSEESENGLDLLKGLYDLSLITKETAGITTRDSIITTAGHEFKDHHLLNQNTVRGAADLDFIMRTNLAATASWTSVGDATTCFGGNIHGDGHYVSGLDNSLFGKLCGNVYNLGVIGTFTGGGIADSGSGTAENCWVKTTGTPTGKAIIGTPDSDSQIKNCYYPSTNAFTAGSAIAKTENEFYNGLVTYNLNRFFLQKRFNLNRGGQTAIADTMYVQSRYGNPDFIYAEGEIPEEINEDREKKNPLTGDLEKDPVTGEQLYVPLYPYDYLFFGQSLNYGYLDEQAHQDVPSPIVKDEDHVETDITGNRVLRAPAYFGDSTKKTVYFNPYGVFAKHKKDDAETLVHNGMTAIDFTGFGDVFNDSTGVSIAYVNDNATANPGDTYFKPLLDAGGMSNFFNFGLTKNLLVYTEAPETGAEASAEGKTGRAVELALAEDDYEETDATYRTVAKKNEAVVAGHWVQRASGTTGYEAHYDHFLVDRQDFHAPMGYTFEDGHVMWHQRTPDTYVDFTKGWETVSLPFEVECVTTQDKGELTHFYGTNSIGHEYWLREYTAIEADDEPATMRATFSTLARDEDADTKVYTNTFLWDYYYDTNDARRQVGNNYYSESHDYDEYPLQQAAKPYIIGFPGRNLCEFDLSGEWTTSHLRLPRPVQLDKQVVTFVSSDGITINKSDDDMATGDTIIGYTFKPNYVSRDFAAGSNVYIMTADGSKFEKVPATGDATSLLPFRAYFVASASGSKVIIFSDAEGKPDTAPDDVDDREPTVIAGGRITFTPGAGTITAKSTLDEPRVVLVYSASGALVKAFDIRPDSTVTIHVPSGLVYAVRTVSGDYSGKLFVR